MSRNHFGRHNPNWRNAGWHICIECDRSFHSYQKASKYCSQECYLIVRRRKAKSIQKRLPFGTTKRHRICPYCHGFILIFNEGVKTCGSPTCREKHFAYRWRVKLCDHCGIEFKHPRSAKRKFCSYKCFVENGGPKRAGRASSIVIMKKYGPKKDANHKELVAALEKMGVLTIDMSGVGGGFPDLICAVCKETLLVEIKNKKTGYGRKGLNKLQREFAENWAGGPVYVIYNLDDATKLANYELGSLYAYGGYNRLNVVA